MSERGSCNKRGGEKCKQQILSTKEFTFVVSFFSWWTTWWLKKRTNYRIDKMFGRFHNSKKVQYEVRKWNYNSLIVFKLLHRYKQVLVIILYLLMYQCWDTCVFARFISHFWSKMNKQGVAIRTAWCAFSKQIPYCS